MLGHGVLLPDGAPDGLVELGVLVLLGVVVLGVVVEV